MAMLIRRGAVPSAPTATAPPVGRRVGGPTLDPAGRGLPPQPPAKYTGPVGHGQRRAWLNTQQQGPGIGQEKVIPGGLPKRKRPPVMAQPPMPMPPMRRPRPQEQPMMGGSQMQAAVPPQAESQAMVDGQRNAMRRPFTRER